MSYVKDVVKASVNKLFPDGTFYLSRKWKGQVKLNQMEASEFPFFMFDNISSTSNAEIKPNYNYTIWHNFVLSCFVKVDNNATDEDKEASIDTTEGYLRDVAGDIYKSIRVYNGGVITKFTKFPELFSGIYGGAALNMTIPELKKIEPCE